MTETSCFSIIPACRNSEEILIVALGRVIFENCFILGRIRLLLEIFQYAYFQTCDRFILASSLEDFPVLCMLGLVKAFDLCIPYSYIGVGMKTDGNGWENPSPISVAIFFDRERERDRNSREWE